MNVSVVIEIGEKSGRWGSIENVGRSEVSFDWPAGVPLPGLSGIVDGLLSEAVRLHLEEKAKNANE
jgi:hypothetical protein